MKRETQPEYERAQSERLKLAEREQPTFSPATECPFCFGSGRRMVMEDGYNVSKKCNHEPLPPEEEIPF